MVSNSLEVCNAFYGFYILCMQVHVHITYVGAVVILREGGQESRGTREEGLAQVWEFHGK